ncbi:MAG: ABC transporter ATP-binding protein [Brachybacterium tyrofermentans]|uniref:ABC transporter ATP-binding protein n=1 Tax=Brachybacterium tyrofermentans TaxID=47848 RepID=UPI001868264A|nr:ABC transporter ATP-binding protein [Brachybacterium tyrofermentans]
MTHALEVIDVRRSLRARPVLEGLDLTVDAGTCRALVGLNGAGKTTALRVMLGMLHPDSGSIRIHGQDIGSARGDLWGRVGHLVEMPFSYPELTARENIAAAARLHGASGLMVQESIRDLGDILRMTPWLDIPAARLSLGTRQKVGLAAAFAHRPDLVVLDEPTNGLDPLAVVGLRELITAFTRDGGAALVTSHHFDEVARIADQVDILHRGRVRDSLAPDGPDLERRFFEVVLAADIAEGRP